MVITRLARQGPLGRRAAVRDLALRWAPATASTHPASLLRLRPGSGTPRLSPSPGLVPEPGAEVDRIKDVASRVLDERLDEVVEAVGEANDSASAVREVAAGDAAAGAAPLPFLDPREAFVAKSTGDLVRSILVFTACRVQPLVRNAESILSLSKRVFGSTIVNAVVRRTFYRQFVAGADAEEIRPALQFLASHGVHVILDYAAEDDVEAAREGAAHSGDAASAGAAAYVASSAHAGAAGLGGSSTAGPRSAPVGSSPSSPPHAHEGDRGASAAGFGPLDEEEAAALLSSAPVSARTFAYEGEAVCDARAAIFLRAIEAAGSGGGQGFAAIKVTALGVPQLLERVSTALTAIRDLFSALDADGDGTVRREEWADAYRSLFTGATDEEIARAFATLDQGGDGRVDALEWSDSVTVHQMAQIAARCREEGPFSRAVLSPEELALYNATLGRVDALAAAAAKHGVRLLVDAEHSYFQPVIDHVVARLQATYNRDTPVLYNTYQCYLVDSHARIRQDVERAKRVGYKFGAKLVRGAYMVLERRHAAALGRPSPVHATIADTHVSYDGAVRMLLDEVAEGTSEFMVATHNQDSVERAVEGMAARRLPPSSPVFFGQLLGMADNLTFVLGAHGYGAYKYVPYGTVDEVIPYLVRRAQENSDMLGGVDKELGLMKTELKRRIFG